jgi:hypothetical protein
VSCDECGLVDHGPNVTSGTQAIIQEKSSAFRINVLPLRDHVTFSCIWPEIPVNRAHCSAVVLYVFSAILAKSRFFISINNSIKTY